MNTFSEQRSIYHNLPHPDYMEFIGRKQELAELQRLLSPQNRAWVIMIDGIGGIGKSALALEAAYRYLPPTMRRGRGRGAAADTLNLPPDLYRRLKQVLLQCRVFDDMGALLALFVDARISQWRAALPTTATTLEQRVLAVIGALYDQYSQAGENALALFLHVLCDQVSPQHAHHAQLATLAEDVAQAGKPVSKPADTLQADDEGFEAIVWVSAKNTVLTADGIAPRTSIFRALDDIYIAIAVALEYEAITRACPEEQDEIVRRALTQQRTLLIVDNLETVDDEHVLTFLRELPPPTKAIVTTRHRIDVAYPIRLTGMPEDDALALIAHEAEKKGVTLTDDQAQRLFARTGGIPLALVWSVAHMAYGYGVEAVLRKLGEPTGNVTRFIFEEAMARIQGKPAYKLLLALSLFATDASREALGYVADLPELDRDEGLVELEKLSLVNREGGRFSMMAMTKGYVEHKFKESPNCEELTQKWLQWGSNFIRKYGGFDLLFDILEKLQQMETEFENLRDILTWSRGKDIDLFIYLANGLSYFLYVKNFIHELNFLIKDTIRTISSVGRANEAATLLYLQGRVCYMQGDYERAVKLMNEAGNKAKNIGELALEIETWIGQTGSLIRLEPPKIQKAYGLIQKAFNAVQELEKHDPDRANYLKAYGAHRLARLALLTDNDVALSEYWIQEAESYVSSKRWRLLAWLKFNHGEIELMKENWEDAEELFKEASKIGEDCSEHWLIAHSHLGLAKLCANTGNQNDLCVSVQQALEAFQKVGAKSYEGQALQLLQEYCV